MANAICVMIGQVNAFGVVFFKMEVTECVLVKGEFTGLPPGKHGLHIHSFGDLTNGWISAGPYYNPDDETHGAEEENKKHAGDLGTLEVNEDGLAKLDLTVQHFHLTGIHSIIGRSLVANGQVLIKGTFTGLTRGKHGLHVCTFGNLFNGYHSIGPHFNPRKKLHGGQQDNERHVGDLGNIEANEEGVAEFQIEDQLICLSGAESIIGRAMVIQAEEDDLGKGANEESLITGNTSTGLAWGVIGITEDTEEVFVKGTIEGLKPGKHGLYVCALGNITNGYISSGTHYNPCDKKHGGPEDTDRHVGDLGNIEANDDGVATFEMHDRLLRLAGNYSIIGRTLVVTENEDDLGKGENEDSVATGNAGNGLAWGVIGIANK